MKENITAFEGTLHKLTVNVSGVEDFSDYLVYGAAQPYGCSKCAHFEVVTKTEGTCEMIIPALSCGIYKYQLFIKRISTNQEFLILEGEINVKDRLCDCSAVTSNDETATVVDATFSADTVEVNVSIQEGAEGKPGPQGPQGEPGKDGEGSGTAEISSQMTREAKKKMVQDYYGINLDLYPTWIIYNELGGITALSDDLVPDSLNYCDIERVDGRGDQIGLYNFLGKEIVNFELDGSYNTSMTIDDMYLNLYGRGFDTTKNLIKFHLVDEENENTVDFRKYPDVNWAVFYNNNAIENITILSAPEQFISARFDNCYQLKKCDIDTTGIKSGSDMFAFCKNLENVSLNYPNLVNGYDMFRGCKKLAGGKFNLPKLREAQNMFLECENLTSFISPECAPSNISSMFNGCKKLENVEMDFSNATNTYGTFVNCKSFTSINLALPKTSTIGNLFTGCENLTSCTIDAPLSTSASGLFRGCVNLTSFEVDLSNAESLYDCFSECKNLTSFEQPITSTKNNSNMFRDCVNLTSFKSDMENCESAYNMFSGCKNLTSFDASLKSLTNGSYMFQKCYLDADSVKRIANSITNENIATSNFSISYVGCQPEIINNLEIIELFGITSSTNMSSVSKDFKNLNNAWCSISLEPRFSDIVDCNFDLNNIPSGNQMFRDSLILRTFDSDLSNAINTNHMFSGCKNLISYRGELPKVQKAQYMFQNTPLESFNEDLSTLQDGYYMFNGCKKLTSFRGNLSSLTSGAGMFMDCNLDAESVRHILTSLNSSYNSAKSSFNMGIKRSAVPVVTELTGLTPTSTTTHVNVGRYKYFNLYIKITSED